jgi:predicted dehydrogenase
MSAPRQAPGIRAQSPDLATLARGFAPLRVLVVGLGQMGRSHALAYHRLHPFEIVGLVNRSPVELPPELDDYPRPASFEEGLALRPDVVSINTYTDSHAALAIAALEAGAHVFVEKPLALTLDDARAVVDAARRARRKLVVGYILRHHPAWVALIDAARTLGPPYVMRMNLNQTSGGTAWEIHKRLLQTTSPVVDCGIHYVDVMCQIAGCRPVQVRGMGARLAGDIAPGQVNYAHLQVLFEDGSVGWYEAGWGPMMSPVACFVKDVVGARGSASLLVGGEKDSADIESHTEARRLRVNRLAFDAQGRATATESVTSIDDALDHQALCEREQAFLARAIAEDLDLHEHHADALRSLAIVLAADLGMRERRAVDL